MQAFVRREGDISGVEVVIAPYKYLHLSPQPRKILRDFQKR